MSQQANELKKLAVIATDIGLSADLRTKSIELIGSLGTHDALLTLLELAANKDLSKEERDLALMNAREIIQAGR